jgi:hypothetical protein
MNKTTVFAHSNKGHLPAKLQVSNSGESYWIELYNEGGGNTDQKWHFEVFKRDAIQSMVSALAAHFESLPPVGTFKCPICGSASIHKHSGDEIAEHRIANAALAATIKAVPSEALDSTQGKK